MPGRKHNSGPLRGRRLVFTYLTRLDQWYITAQHLENSKDLVMGLKSENRSKAKAAALKGIEFVLAARPQQERKAGGKRTQK